MLHIADLAGQQVGLPLFERAEGLGLALHDLPVDPGIDIARIVVSRFQVGKGRFERIAVVRSFHRAELVGCGRVEITNPALRTGAFDITDAHGTLVADLLDAGRFHDIDAFGLVVVAGGSEECAGRQCEQ